MSDSRERSVRSIGIIWILIILMAVSVGTLAWFTFTTYTNVTPMTGTVSDSGVNLLISNAQSGPFDISCDLILNRDTETLRPVTTNDLSTFSVVSKQDTNGIAKAYRSLAEPDTYMLHGTVYLTSIDASCNIYFNMENMYFGEDVQALASLRFGVIATNRNGSHKYIFKLDDMGDTSKATSRVTTEKENCVWDGSALAGDPALQLSSHAARDEAPLAGAAPLCDIAANEVISVEYFVYLEGCDENCFNDVQKRDLALQMGFYGAE